MENKQEVDTQVVQGAAPVAQSPASKTGTDTSEDQTKVKEMVQCPFCGEEIRATAIKCKHCRSVLNDEEQSPLENQARADVESLPEAGGYSLQQTQEDGTKSNFGVIFMVLFIVVVVVISFKSSLFGVREAEATTPKSYVNTYNRGNEEFLAQQKAKKQQADLKKVQTERQIADLFAQAEKEEELELWENIVPLMRRVLELDPSNKTAKIVLESARLKIEPGVKVRAMVDGKQVSASVYFTGTEKHYDTGEVIFDIPHSEYLWLSVTYKDGNRSYKGSYGFECNHFTGAETITVDLEQIGFDNGVVSLPRGVTLEMKYIEPGTFIMGSPLTERFRSDNETRHQVRLTKGFWAGEWEVTEAEYCAVMFLSNKKYSDNRPVQISWEDATGFCEILNNWAGNTLPEGYKFDLPTEAQWEYACRAGTSTAFPWGDSWDEDAARPNAWGLYHMNHGISEWCKDWYDEYPKGNATDPMGPASGNGRVIRGTTGTRGSTLLDLDDPLPHRRSARRVRSSSSSSRNGFRLFISHE